MTAARPDIRALAYLEQLHATLLSRREYKRTEHLLDEMERAIRSLPPDQLDATKTALGVWLRGTDRRRILRAVHLASRLGAREHLAELRRLRERFVEGRDSHALWWQTVIEAVLKGLA